MGEQLITDPIVDIPRCKIDLSHRDWRNFTDVDIKLSHCNNIDRCALQITNEPIHNFTFFKRHKGLAALPSKGLRTKSGKTPVR